MKKWILRIAVVLVVAIIALAGVKEYKALTTPQKTHYHAGFVVFDNNKKIDFSKAKYMSVSPCTLHETEDDSPEAIQHDKAHLHDYVGDVVHVERTGAKWGDLFVNINYPIDFSKVTAYLNGQQVQNIQDQPIKTFDSVVFFIGKNDVQKDLKQAVTKAHIEEEGKKSEDCGAD
jgi:hypothetical protein